MSTLDTFTRELIPRRVPTVGDVLDADRLEGAFAGALAEFARTRPRELAEELTGTGAFDYALDGATPALTAWRDGRSSIISIAYPYVASDRTPPMLDGDGFAVIRLPGGLKLRFLSATPAVGEKALVTYTSLHVVDSSSCSVLASDEEGLADLAACYACEALAGYYSQSTAGSIAADTVAHLSKAQEYRAQAKRWRDAYLAKMAGDAADAPAAGAVAIASTFPTAARYFFHGSR